MNRTHPAAFTCLWLLWVVPVASAQQTSPPTNVAGGTIEPDRPDVTNGPHLVGLGLLQLELGGIYTRGDAARWSFASPVTARVGLFEWLEGRVGTDGLLIQRDESGHATGLGNLQLGAKVRLWAGSGVVPPVSILPNVNVPTASTSKGLGSGDPDYTLALLTGTDVGSRGHVDVNYGIGAIGAGNGRPHFTQQLVSVSGSVAANAHWNPYAEVFWFFGQSADQGAVTAVDTGAIFIVSPRLALDGGAQWGVSRAAPGFACFGGVSFIVGEVLGGHGVQGSQRWAERRAPESAPHR